MKSRNEALMERRDRTRFPLQREVRYRTAGARAGIGTTVDLSKTALAFDSDATLPLGASIEVSVSWPTEHDAIPMRLIATGRVVRSHGGITACTIEEFAFRLDGDPDGGDPRRLAA